MSFPGEVKKLEENSERNVRHPFCLGDGGKTDVPSQAISAGPVLRCFVHNHHRGINRALSGLLVRIRRTCNDDICPLICHASCRLFVQGPVKRPNRLMSLNVLRMSISFALPYRRGNYLLSSGSGTTYFSYGCNITVATSKSGQRYFLSPQHTLPNPEDTGSQVS